MILHLSLELTEAPASVGTVRHLIRTILEKERVAEQDITDIETVVGELASNAVLHAPADGFQVEFVFKEGRAVITVADHGEGFALSEVPPVGSVRSDPHGEARYGGFGLLLVRMLADRVEFARTEPQGTTVRAEKALHFRSLPP